MLNYCTCHRLQITELDHLRKQKTVTGEIGVN
jgi:hypothetical protein